MKEIIAAGKPVFMDKPVAASLKDAVEIYKLAATAQVPVFSASAVRWYPGVLEVANAEQTPALGAISYGPAHILPHHPDLFFYGIHPTEALFTVMGPGCQSVIRTTTPSESVVTGIWSGGRSGTLVAIHEGAKAYKLIRFGDSQVTEQKSEGDYTPMLREIVKFFQTKQAPISPKQTLEIYAFMEAAEESKHREGGRVTLREVMVKAGAPDAWLPDDGTVTARLRMTLSADAQAIFGTFIPQKIELTYRPPEITNRVFLEPSFRRYRLVSRDIKVADTPEGERPERPATPQIRKTL